MPRSFKVKIFVMMMIPLDCPNNERLHRTLIALIHHHTNHRQFFFVKSHTDGRIVHEGGVLNCFVCLWKDHTLIQPYLMVNHTETAIYAGTAPLVGFCASNCSGCPLSI